jgi:hypothetical protein
MRDSIKWLLALSVLIFGALSVTFFARKAGVRPILQNQMAAKPIPTAHTPAPTAPAQLLAQPPALQFVAAEAKAMNQIDPNPAQTLAHLKEVAANLSQRDQTDLTLKTLDSNATINERMITLHLLTLATNTPDEVFIRIGAMNDPGLHSENDFHRQAVTALAVIALDEIQKRALKNPSLINELKRISEHTSSPLLRRVAIEMARATENGRTIVAEAR